MISAQEFVKKGKRAGFELYSGVPCSYLKPFINYVIDSDEVRYIMAPNEGDAVAIASGANLAGKRAVAMFQNAGLGNAVNPLTSLNAIFRIPVLLIVTLRGEPGGPMDEPQHRQMGQITTRMLDTMDIPWEYLPEENTELDSMFERITSHMDGKSSPYALVMKKGTVEPYAIKGKPEKRDHKPEKISGECRTLDVSQRPSRREILKILQDRFSNDSALLATTGFSGRTLYDLQDRDNQLYMVGSMGCISTLGLGLAVSSPDKRVVAIDGDAAILMRMGAMSTVAYERPENLLHIVLDNEMHESTGGQFTISHSVDIPAVAAACGYRNIYIANTADEFGKACDEAAKSDSLSFIYIKTRKNDDTEKLPRPSITPEQVAERLRNYIKGK